MGYETIIKILMKKYNLDTIEIFSFPVAGLIADFSTKPMAHCEIAQWIL